jgi:hypothetical protein
LSLSSVPGTLFWLPFLCPLSLGRKISL